MPCACPAHAVRVLSACALCMPCALPWLAPHVCHPCPTRALCMPFICPFMTCTKSERAHGVHRQGMHKAPSGHALGTNRARTGHEQGLDRACIGHANGTLGARTGPTTGRHGTRTGHAHAPCLPRAVPECVPGVPFACPARALSVPCTCPAHARASPVPSVHAHHPRPCALRRPVHAPGTPYVCTVRAQSVPCVCPWGARCTPRVCLAHALSVPCTCALHAPCACVVHALSMPCTCTVHALCMLRVYQGSVRRGEGGISEGGRRRIWLGPPPPMVPLWSPPKAGRKLLSLNPLGTEGAKAKFWLSASNTGWGGVLVLVLARDPCTVLLLDMLRALSASSGGLSRSVRPDDRHRCLRDRHVKRVPYSTITPAHPPLFRCSPSAWCCPLAPPPYRVLLPVAIHRGNPGVSVPGRPGLS